VTSKVFYTGTFVYGFLLTAGSYSVQLPCETSEARNQGKFTVVKYLSFRLLLLPLCFLLFTSKLSARTQTKISHYTCPQMPRDHAHWEEHEVKLLLTLAIQEKEKFNWNQFGLTREGWRNIYPHFPQYSHKQINNKFDCLKQKYRAWKDSQVATGLGRNTQTGGIDADPDYWMAQDGSQPIDDDFPHAGETSNAAAARGNPPPFLNELHALFGDRNTNTGIYLSGGGIGSETPPHVMSQNDYSGPSSYHSGSKRARGDHVVDSPRKKCCEILGRISDSIAARSSSRDRQRTREQEEVDEAMEILEADGVPVPSDLYFTALELFKNSVSRREFLNIKSPQVRIAWLTWLIQHKNQK